MISVVMLNWRRPKYVELNVARYSEYSLISEIVIFSNAGLPLDFKLHGKEPILISSTRDLGLYTRFAAAVLCKNECIMHVDDDIFVPESTVNSLYSCWCSNNRVCHSLHGRKVNNDYLGENVYGRVEVVLTRCLVVSRDICAQALTHVHHFDDFKSEPYGNGEDIILSFTAMKGSGELNLAHRLPYTNYPGYAAGEPGQETLSVHKRWAGHKEHRSKLISRCREYFELKVDSYDHQDKDQLKVGA